MKNSKLIILAVTLLAASCQKEVQVKTPPYTPKLTVNSTSSTDEPIVINIGKSASIQDKKYNPTLMVTNATVSLYENDSLRQTVIFEATSTAYVSTVTPTPGKRYSIKVEAPGFTAASSACIAPAFVAIQNYSRKINARTDADGSLQDELSFSFADPATKGDFYIIRIHPPLDSYQYSSETYCVNSADASVETFTNENVDVTTCLDNNNIFMRDELFNGQKKTVKLYVGGDHLQPLIYGADTSYPILELLHVTEDYFKYEKSRISADNSNGDPFAEPVNVYTNITNGYGIFSVLVDDRVFIK